MKKIKLNPSMKERYEKVAKELEDDPKKMRAYSCINVPLIPSAGDPVHIVVAVRTEIGIMVGELKVPREQWNTEQFIEAMKTLQENVPA